MTKQEAFAILQKFEKVLTEQFRLEVMDITKDCGLKGDSVRRLVACVHDALPWPDENDTIKEAILVDALEDVAANCSPCKTDHAGPALEKYRKIMAGENPGAPSGNP